MRANSVVLVFVLFSLLATFSVAECGVLPEGAIGCIPFTVVSDNTMSINTQIMLNFDVGSVNPYVRSDLANIQPYNITNGVDYIGWNENGTSNTVNSVGIWVLVPQGFTNDSDIALAIYPMNVVNYNATGDWGEAPELSESNGIYDNGKLEFPAFYSNFSYSTDWTGVGGGVTSSSFSSNGLGLSDNWAWGGFRYSTGMSNAGDVLEGYIMAASGDYSSVAIGTCSGSFFDYLSPSYNNAYEISGTAGCGNGNGGTGKDSTGGAAPHGTWLIEGGQTDASTGIDTEYINYNAVVSQDAFYTSHREYSSRSFRVL